jgi:hypothetical protein
MRSGCAQQRSRLNGAAPESNRASVGLPRLTGFEDRLGHRARATPCAESTRGSRSRAMSWPFSIPALSGWERSESHNQGEDA